MPYTNRSDPKENPWYPRGASDLADALIDELDVAQVRQLYDALRTQTIVEWWVWLESHREEISEYDGLTAAQRKRRLQKTDKTSALRLHHACIFVELWRARTHAAYYHFPPYGRVPDTPHAQRSMMLAIVDSYNKFEPHDVWPFEVPDGVDFFPLFPFLED